MGSAWKEVSPEVKVFIDHLKEGMREIIKENVVGFYIHGSLAMGGFNPNRSDIEVLVVTDEALKVDVKRLLARFLLECSNSPFPVEISFLNRNQLKNWRHPCPFDFHYSEFWRERYEEDLSRYTFIFLNEESSADGDLAAHITIISHRGICMDGDPIANVFPGVPRTDYISSIMGDFRDCVQHIEHDPVYCTLNLIRVFWYLKEGIISSKQEAGRWGREVLPHDLRLAVDKAVNIYAGKGNSYPLDKNELFHFKSYITNEVDK